LVSWGIFSHKKINLQKQRTKTRFLYIPIAGLFPAMAAFNFFVVLRAKQDSIGFKLFNINYLYQK